MTICEIIDERNRTIRIDYWRDGKTQVVQSHTYSTMFMLKYQQIMEYLTHNRIIPKELTYTQETHRRTMVWIKVYATDEEKKWNEVKL